MAGSSVSTVRVRQGRRDEGLSAAHGVFFRLMELRYPTSPIFGLHPGECLEHNAAYEATDGRKRFAKVDASLGEDCSNARCVVVNSACMTASAGSRRCACVNKSVQISPTECSMGPSILSSTISQVFCTDPSRTSQTLGSILLDELRKFPTVTFSTTSSVHPGGILDLRNSSERIDVVLVREISASQTFVVTLLAAAGEFNVRQDVTVRVTPYSFNEINLNKIFSGSVRENSPPGTYVANVAVSIYTEYKFADSSANGLFNLNPASGIVTTAVGLDRENTDQAYTEFPIQAYSGDQCAIVTIGRLITNVTDVNDNAPTFSSLSYTGRVKENSIPGTVVDFLVDVAVTDKDIGENGVINFALTGTGSNFFAVEKSNHNQFTIKTSGLRIDREVTPYVVLTLTGTDNPSNPQTGTTILNITVVDVNDNAPQFNPGTTVFLVNENIGPTTIATLTATDKDEGWNGQVTYSLIEGGFGLFGVDENTGAVSTVKQIDRETRQVFLLYIQARDQGSPSLESVTTITVNIRDVNDKKPTFSQTVYKGNYRENVPCIMNILTVAATDLDEGSNANIRFSTTSSNFTVDPTSGAIRCANPLDYEEMQQHLIEIKAENPGTPSMSDTVTVEINVEDVNDNSPRFDKPTYQSMITTLGWVSNNPVVVFEVTDDDSGTNGQFTFSMSGETDKFFIDGESVGVLRIKAGASLPGASTTYSFDVTATDKGSPPRSVSVPVSVDVQTIPSNSNALFSSQGFVFTIVENQIYTTPFGAVKASQDGSVSVRYSLLLAGDFAIDPTSGQLTCSIPQDREAAPEHTMVVRARDIATNASDVAVVTVTIDDVNDNAPRFLTTPAQHVFSVLETAMGMPVGSVTAVDRDAGENGAITYSFESQTPHAHFSINPGSGIITVSGYLDRELIDFYTLTIKVTDNADVPLTATTQATISIMDVNDNSPTFSKTSYAVKVKEDSAKSKLVSVVTATDRDIGCNGAVRYFADTVMVNGTVCPFSVSHDSGAVMVTGDLDYETTSTYDCIVTAVDMDGCDNVSGRLTGSTTLNVTILDVNDNPPVFQGAPYRANISRDAAINSLVTDTITATDRDGVKDGNGVVKYHILSHTDYFSIDRDTGRIYVATALDAVSDDQVTLTIKAADEPQTDPAMEAVTNITITIITDQLWPFFKRTYTFRVKENEAPDKDKSVSVRAYVQRASEEECDCSYEVIGSYTSRFSIDNMTGELRQKQELDREVTGSLFYVTVKATNRQSRLYRTTDVEVTVEDVNDNLPYFNSTQQRFIVYQSAPAGYVIGNVTSLDPDLTSQPRYATSISGDKPVELLTNGTLVVRASLVNYTGVHMVVSVTEDNFDGLVNNALSMITQVYIEVRPDHHNVHAPVFGQATYESSVLFSSTPGVEVPIDDFGATDADGHSVTYAIETRNDRGNLEIDDQTGSISVLIRFDDTVDQIISLVIVATDSHPSPKSGSCTVSITLVGYTETEIVAKAEYLRLKQDSKQRQQFLGLFLTMSILLSVMSIVAVFAIYKWRRAARGRRCQTRSETDQVESGENGYDSMGAKDEWKDYNQLPFRDFSAGVANPAYVSSDARPTCLPPAGPFPDLTGDVYLRTPPPRQ